MTVPWYQNICATTRGFNIFQQGSWKRANAVPGVVLPSPEAFYFLPDQSPRFGVGALIGKGSRKLMPHEVPLVQEMDLADLPDEVVEHPDWQAPWKRGPVIVVPRAAVASLRTAWWIGGIDVVVADILCRVFTPIFQRKKMAAYLSDLGWTI